MPLIYRHVVPNVPAWTAGNGKLVFGVNGKPAHRRLIKFSIVFDWSPAFASDAWWNSQPGLPSYFDSWVGPVDKAVVETQLNTPRYETDGYVTGYYGDPPGGYVNGVARYMSTAGNFRVPAPSGSSAPFSWGMNLFGYLYLDWDANNQWWRWRYHIRNMAFPRYFNTNGGGLDVIPGGYGEIYLVSAQLTNDIRPGATGIALTPTASPTGPYVGTNGATLYSEYAT